MAMYYVKKGTVKQKNLLAGSTTPNFTQLPNKKSETLIEKVFS